jgi:hypothetical protein
VRSARVGILVESSTGGSSVCGGRPRLRFIMRVIVIFYLYLIGYAGARE